MPAGEGQVGEETKKEEPEEARDCSEGDVRSPVRVLWERSQMQTRDTPIRMESGRAAS